MQMYTQFANAAADLETQLLFTRLPTWSGDTRHGSRISTPTWRSPRPGDNIRTGGPGAKERKSFFLEER